MRSRFSLAAVIVAILIVGAVTAPSAGAAPATDACLLVTQAQLSAALGVAMAAGTHTTPEYVKTCTWSPSGGATKSLKFVTLDLQPGDGFDRAKALMEQFKPKNAVINSVSGVGDEAYFTSFGGSINNLMVKKGSVAFKLAIYGDTPPEKAMAVEKTLASQILSKL